MKAVGLYHLNESGKLCFKSCDNLGLSAEAKKLVLKCIRNNESLDLNRHEDILGCVFEFLKIKKTMLYSVACDEKGIVDKVQHAPVLNLFSGMSFITPNLGKANSVAIPLQVGPRKIPYIALEASEYIPGNEMILRDYGYKYFIGSYHKDILKRMVIWNKNGEETSLGLYNITRGQIEQFKEALKTEDFVHCMSILRSTVPDFLYHLSPEEMRKVEELVNGYKTDEKVLQLEKDFFIESRYPQYLSYLNQLEVSHCHLMGGLDNEISPFYKDLFKGNTVDDIFDHSHSAFSQLKAGSFHYPYEEEKFNKDKYYLFPIDFFPEIPELDFKNKIQELGAQALNHYKADNYGKAAELWLNALTLSKDLDFRKINPDHESWKVNCCKEKMVSIGGPMSSETSRCTLGIVWNLANAYQKLGEHEDAMYFFDTYINIARGAKVPLINQERMQQAEEKLNHNYQNYLTIRKNNELGFN